MAYRAGAASPIRNIEKWGCAYLERLTAQLVIAPRTFTCTALNVCCLSSSAQQSHQSHEQEEHTIQKASRPCLAAPPWIMPAARCESEQIIISITTIAAGSVHPNIHRSSPSKLQSQSCHTLQRPQMAQCTRRNKPSERTMKAESH